MCHRRVDGLQLRLKVSGLMAGYGKMPHSMFPFRIKLNPWWRSLLAALVRVTLVVASLQAVAQGDNALHRGLGPDPDSLDPHLARSVSSLNLIRDLREGLMSFDAAGDVVPGVALAHVREADGLVYRFQLDPAARWEDGQPLTAADFVRSLRRAFDPATASPTASLLEAIGNGADILAGRLPVTQLGVSALSDHELELKLDRPLPWLLELLTHPVSFPLPEMLEGEPRDWPGNGPYRLIEAVPRNRYSLEKNPHYPDAADVGPDSVHWYPISDAHAELARYRAGDLHITETIPAGRLEWLQANLTPGELRIAPYQGSYFLGLNLRQPPLDASPQLRRALALAVDRDVLTRQVLGGGQSPAWGVVPPGLGLETPQASGDQADRIARARKLYRDAGYGPRRPLRLELRYNTSPTHRRTAIAVAAMWKQVLGVRTRLINEEWKVFVSNRSLGRVTEAFRGGWIADYADPHSFLALFESGNPQNWSGYSNERYDRLLEASATARGAERMQLLGTAQALLLEDQPIIPLYYYASRHLVKPSVRGFLDNPRDVHLSRHLRLVPE